MSPRANNDAPVLDVVFSDYLDRLRVAERAKPLAERRHVPTLRDLADEIGVDVTWLSRVVNNNTPNIGRRLCGNLIAAMRRAGFAMELSDLLRYREAAPLGLEGNDDAVPLA